jgi:lipopolysaccharide exporter
LLYPTAVPADSTPDRILQRTARGAGWVMAWRLGMRGLGLVSTLILVRLIAPADFGIIALATGFMQTIDGMLDLGTEEAVIREAMPDRAYYDTAFTLNLLRGLSVTIVVALLAFPAARFFDDQRLGPVLLFVALLPVLDGCSNIGAVDFRRDFAFDREFALMVLPKACGIAAAITVAFLTRSYVAMLFGMGVNRAMRVVMTYVMHPYRPSLSLRSWRGLAHYSLWTWLLSMAVLLRDRCDSLLIGRLMNSAAVGFYSVGAEIAALPTTELIEPLGRAAFSGFALGRREQTDVAEAYLRMIGFAALIVLPAGAGLSLVATPLVSLAFGPDWFAAVPVLRILAIAFTVMVLGHLSQHLLSAHALLGRLTGITLAAAAVRIALLAAMIPAFGLMGAASAATLAVIVEQAAIIVIALQRLHVRATRLISHLWRPVVATLVMSAGLAAAHLGWNDKAGVPALLLSASIGAVLYLVSLMLAWLAAGKPGGAEADAFTMLRRLAERQSRRR